MYCPKCGNSGRTLDGSLCDCQLSKDTFYADLQGIDIPEQYQGALFTKALVPNDCIDGYGEILAKLHAEITTMQLQHQNLCICSPPAHSKTIWAYSCIQNLFRQRLPVIPLYDVMELRKMMMDYDTGRSNEADILSVRYLFVRIQAEVTYQVRATIATLIDRRVRRGNSTIFLYNGTWKSLTFGDESGLLKGLKGDGSFSSIHVYNYPLRGG